jgi:catechol 2,3-dioxygenase-like lactoylglutathione lyase family enzyme
VVAAGAASVQRPALLAGVDHVPVAVRNLERAAETYRRLGFVLKPGTPHANGVRNLHAKFRDGTEIELITAPSAVDQLTQTYVDHLKHGDGPAFLALHAPDARALAEVVPANHAALRYIFFGGLNHSPTDRPEHVQHTNTAESLASVWLAADEFVAELDLLGRAGMKAPQPETVITPAETVARVVRFNASSLVLLPASHQRIAGRRIVGATVIVRDVGTASSVLRANGVALTGERATAHGRSVFVAPDLACGWWLELLQRRR